MRFLHILSNVFSILDPQSPGHVHVSTSAGRFAGMRYIRLHCTTETNGPKAVVRLDVRVSKRPIACGHPGIVPGLFIAVGAVKHHWGCYVPHSFGGETTSFTAEYLGQVAWKWQLRSLRITTSPRNVEIRRLLGLGRTRVSRLVDGCPRHINWI